MTVFSFVSIGRSTVKHAAEIKRVAGYPLPCLLQDVDFRRQCGGQYLLLRKMCTNLSRKLLKDKAYVNGEWVMAGSGASFAVLNPANGSIVGHVPDMNISDTEKAVEAAHTAFHSWKKVAPKVRSDVLRRWYNLIDENKDDIASIITAEMGKTRAEALGEMNYGASFVEWFSEEARRIYGQVIESPAASRRLIVIKQPIGVAGMITPWNFPCGMVTRKVAPAIAAGCTVILKPSEDTPLTALALAELAHDAGMPAGVLNIVTASRQNTPEVGRIISEHRLISKVTFTGSTEVGKLLLKQAAGTVKHVSMELGGNAPFLVFDSANVKQAAAAAVPLKFRMAGQTCTCANRMYVQENVHDEFVAELVGLVKHLKVGDGAVEGTSMGPLINRQAVEKVDGQVKDATARGATIHVGGAHHHLGGNYYQPTVITGIKEGMKICLEETFGPLAGISKFKTEEEVVALANSTRMGLAGYLFSNDIAQCWRVGEALEFGMIGINEGVFTSVEIPFGGVKESGLGREGSNCGIEEFVEKKVLVFGNL